MKQYIAVYIAGEDNLASLVAIFLTEHPAFHANDQTFNQAEVLSATLKGDDASRDIHLREYYDLSDVSEEISLDNTGTIIIDIYTSTIASYMTKQLFEKQIHFELDSNEDAYAFSIPDSTLDEVKRDLCADLIEGTDYDINQR